MRLKRPHLKGWRPFPIGPQLWGIQEPASQGACVLVPRDPFHLVATAHA